MGVCWRGRKREGVGMRVLGLAINVEYKGNHQENPLSTYMFMHIRVRNN